MSLASLNAADPIDAAQMFRQCCTAERWVESMASARPFSGEAQLRDTADQVWQGLAEADYLQAFDGHPKIGDVNSLRSKYADTKALASGEQSSVATASDAVIAALAEGNRAYEEKFGFIFIVCATGKSAEEMLQLLQARLPDDRPQELINAAEEQRKIFQLRLEKLL